MDYLQVIPEDLINEIAVYLDYIESIKFSLISGVDLRYEYLLSVKFPGFYKFVKIVKSKSINYRDFPYRKAYDLIHQQEKYMKAISAYGPANIHYRDKYTNIYTDDIEEYIETVTMNDFDITEFEQLFDEYHMLIKDSDYHKYYKYRIEYPNIAGLEGTLIIAIMDYEYYVSSGILRGYVENFKFEIYPNLHYEPNLLPLVTLYLILLIRPELTDILKSREDLRIAPTDPDKFLDLDIVIVNNYMIMYQHIIDYINSY
jgi:hypothetical protein